jgi:hypothetical protein
MFYPRRKQPRACVSEGERFCRVNNASCKAFRLLVSFSSKKGVSTDTDSNSEVPRIGFSVLARQVNGRLERMKYKNQS